MINIKYQDIKYIVIFIFILFVVAMSIVFADQYNKNVSEEISKDILLKKDFICIDEETGKTFFTKDNRYKLYKVKEPYSDERFKYVVLFEKENISFETVFCTEYREIKVN